MDSDYRARLARISREAQTLAEQRDGMHQLRNWCMAVYQIVSEVERGAFADRESAVMDYLDSYIGAMRYLSKTRRPNLPIHMKAQLARARQVLIDE